MGREKRICCPGLIYHVINRGNNRQVIFLEDEDYGDYLNLVQHYKKKYAFKVFAFCLMTNHVHLLLKVSEKASISKVMQSLTIGHTKRYQFKYQVSGHVWQGRFKSPIISDDEYLLTTMKYIEQNPLKANMVLSIEDYQWSSYRLNVREEKSILIDRNDNPIFQCMGKNEYSRINQYKNEMSKHINDDEFKKLKDIYAKENGYMSERFKKEMCELLPKKRKRGRPRKSIFEECTTMSDVINL